MEKQISFMGKVKEKSEMDTSTRRSWTNSLNMQSELDLELRVK